MKKTPTRRWPAGLALGTAALLCAAASGSQDVPDFPARDAHQGVLIAADPYLDAARARARFGKKNMFEAGFLAVELFVRNDNDFAVRVDLDSIQLQIRAPGAARQRLDHISLEEVLERMLSKGGHNPTRPRTPLPIPRGAPSRSKEWQKLEAAWRPLVYEMDVLPPRSTARGFLFFNMGGRFHLVTHSTLYIPDLYLLPENKALLFFELELAPAAR